MKKIPKIDENKCTLCMLCVDSCPQQVLSIENNRVNVTVDECMICSHCLSLCKFDAIEFDSNVLQKPEFKTFNYKETIVPFKEGKPGNFINTMRSRRSIRKFKEKELSKDSINDLIQFAVTAPSGSNCQDWEFTVVHGRDKVWDLAMKVKDFFLTLNKLAGNPFIRYGSFLFAGKALIQYYNEHMESVQLGLEEAEKGNDLLFHGAPEVIILHSSMEGSTPIEDAQYASYNITLLSHLLGIGTCYIGYAVEAINRVSKIKKYLEIPKGHRVHAVLALGYPAISFSRFPLRKPFNVTWL